MVRIQPGPLAKSPQVEAFRVVLGSPEVAARGLLEIAQGNVPRTRVSDQIAAWRELLDRGYGKAPAFASIEGGDPLEFDDVAAEINAIADELRARRDSKATTN